ncbi:helix-turn-helix domain-containing protein [Pseudazoarcus pumilus]|uniref:Uncharacterized protein n=1 Tax=Pseudazoarcus pumilus TaxID=2067960 RepID=A0A2I6S9I1_9RHOO|nr:hypothetical protein [Pseudazoarcus pumilus]AUN95899.1 hypothetical protein C0099_13735 [Pseudazoarcus pumilus]
MNAPAVVSADLPDRILAAIGRASSQHPVRADEVRAKLDVGAAEFEPALEALAAECRINTAQIQRRGDAAPWLAIWPTGVQLPSAGWTGKSHRALFVRQAPIVPALRAASAPRTRATAPTPKQEEPAMHKHKRGEMSARALAVLRAAGEPLTVAEVAERIDSSVENTRQLIYRLVDKGQVEKVGERQGLGGSAHCFRATEALPEETPAPPPQVVQPAAETAPDKAPATEATERVTSRLQFSLWDDGRLCIHDADQIIQIFPDDTARLARLLGVPAHTDYPLKGA